MIELSLSVPSFTFTTLLMSILYCSLLQVSLLSGLRHPQVVLLLGVCTMERLPLMLLEYMSQGSLYAYLHNQEKLVLLILKLQ